MEASSCRAGACSGLATSTWRTVFSAVSFSSPSHSACALLIQQVGILRVLRERLRQDAFRVGEAAALDEIERLFGVDGGTRGLVVHVINDA